ncbi:MAG TPA: SDR family NAD(P)-dependent oxidoreductase [Abditibacteriaceae bacterium]|jgi:NAD(P)-dependent dehydrogenase (short-subunit alcohol dehydrogenase family)
MDFNGQVVVITGGSRGIGYGIAECFARRNATIVVADMDEAAALEATGKLREIGAGEALGLACNIACRDDVEKMVTAVVARFGRIDVLVNNAGICPFVDIMEMEPETWQKSLDVNLTGAFHCTQLVGRHMRERGQGGRIVFITSLAENLTQPNQVDYGASKAGLKMAMAGFATALGPHGITCNAVAPGMILTPMTAHYWTQPGPAEKIKQLVPVGRIGTPEDIGKAIVFLASDDAAYINGVTLRVDGGFQVLIKG